MNGTTLRVVKVGGSLFSDDRFPGRLSAWLDQQGPATTVLVAGGGPLADVVRDWDQRFSLARATSHWMCVDLMRVTARFLEAVLPGSVVISSIDDIRRATPARYVLDPFKFVREETARRPGGVPCDWTVTSDSIAALVADAARADELVLLKSLQPPASASATELAAQGIVDAFFPQAIAGVASWRICRL